MTPSGGGDPLHRYKPHKHWVALRFNPLQKPFQTVTQPVTLEKLMDLKKPNSEKTVNQEQLCLECGMCCNGVIFADVRLRKGDDGARLRAMGLRMKGKSMFCQPCAALEGCRCRIYEKRPRYCREFECTVLQSFNSGKLKKGSALRIIREAKKRVRRVKELLRKLGDRDEEEDLRGRFRRMARKLERPDLDEVTGRAYGELTLAMHDLNQLLREAFYPG